MDRLDGQMNREVDKQMNKAAAICSPVGKHKRKPKLILHEFHVVVCGMVKGMLHEDSLFYL